MRVVEIFECTSCKLVFAEAEEAVIDSHEPFWERARAAVDTQERTAADMAARRKALYEKLLGRPVKSILEIGCGLGTWAHAWRDLGCEYTGIEYVAKAADAARERTGARIIAGEFTEVSNGHYDVAFCSQVVEHVALPTPFFAKARQSADLLHVDVPNQDSLAATFRKLFSRSEYGAIQPPHHLRAYTKGSLRTTLERNGFQVELCRGFRNDHAVFGQLSPSRALIHQAVYTAAEAAGRGSLLVALALSNGQGRPEASA